MVLPLTLPASEPTKQLQKLVEENKLGLKTGQGLFTYKDNSPESVKSAYIHRLLRQRGFSEKSNLRAAVKE